MGSGPGMSTQDADRVELLISQAASVQLSAVPETRHLAFPFLSFFYLFLTLFSVTEQAK